MFTKKSFPPSPIWKEFVGVGGRRKKQRKKRSWKYLQTAKYLDLKEKEPCNVPSHSQACPCSAVMWHLML